MAIIHFPNDLQRYTGGLAKLDIEAPRVRELFLALDERFPGIGAELKKVSIAIDGLIYQDAPYHKLNSGSEIYLVPRIAGG